MRPLKLGILEVIIKAEVSVVVVKRTVVCGNFSSKSSTKTKDEFASPTLTAWSQIKSPSGRICLVRPKRSLKRDLSSFFLITR